MYHLNPHGLIVRDSDGTTFSADSDNPAARAYQAWLAQGNQPAQPPGLTPAQVQAKFTVDIQARLDAWARTRGYDGILSACTYATSSVPKFAAEGQRAVDKRDATWAKSYEILGAVQAGARPMPASLAEIEPELPPLLWPDEDPVAVPA